MASVAACRAIAAACMAGTALLGGGAPAFAHPTSMVTGSRTSQPVGHFHFCQRFLSECSIRPSVQDPHPASPAFLDLLKQINAAVNKAIRPMSDKDRYGVAEFWAFPDWAGDCEDYVLQKQKLLVENGISRANLLITVLRKPDGEGHAVLTVRTTGGDFVLDNLNDEVKPWNDTGYTFLKRQATEHTGRWVTIEEGYTEPLVAAVE